MKNRVLSAFSAFVLICSAGFSAPVNAGDVIEHKEYAVTLTSSSDGAVIVKILAQYMFNENQKMCQCLDLAYDIIKKDKGYNVNVDLCRSNLRGDRGGAYALIVTRYPGGKTEKIALKMKFQSTGEASYEMEKL